MANATRRLVRKRVYLAICLAWWLTPGRTATLSLLSLNDLITKSTGIVQAQVSGSSASYSGSVIYTHYKLNVMAQWKGPAQTTIDLMVPGGTANGMRQTCPGVPQLSAGKQYVLFLWTSRLGQTFTMGFTQGVFYLQGATGNLTAVQMHATESVLAPGTGQAVRGQPISMPLQQLISAISAGGAS